MAIENCRDVFWGGTCDDGCQELADKVGCGVSNIPVFLLVHFKEQPVRVKRTEAFNREFQQNAP